MIILMAVLIVVKSVSFDVFNLLKKLKEFLLNFHLYISDYDSLFSNQYINSGTTTPEMIQFSGQFVPNNQMQISERER